MPGALEGARGYKQAPNVTGDIRSSAEHVESGPALPKALEYDMAVQYGRDAVVDVVGLGK